MSRVGPVRTGRASGRRDELRQLHAEESIVSVNRGGADAAGRRRDCGSRSIDALDARPRNHRSQMMPGQKTDTARFRHLCPNRYDRSRPRRFDPIVPIR